MKLSNISKRIASNTIVGNMCYEFIRELGSHILNNGLKHAN